MHYLNIKKKSFVSASSKKMTHILGQTRPYMFYLLEVEMR